jgi:hypothetical protein
LRKDDNIIHFIEDIIGYVDTVKNDYEDAKDISNAGEPLFYVATE